jgi:hypothetical protein
MNSRPRVCAASRIDPVIKLKCHNLGNFDCVAGWRRVAVPSSVTYLKRAPSRIRPCAGLGRLPFVITDGVSMIDNSMTGTFQINLPKDLLSESKRASQPKSEQLHVEGWRTSWLSRIAEMLVGKD